MSSYSGALGGKKKDEQERPTVLCCAAVVGFLGLSTLLLAQLAMGSESLIEVDNLVRLNSAANQGTVPTFTTLRIYGMLLVVGVLIMIGAMVGIFGIHNRHKPFISCYLIFTVIFSVLICTACAMLFMRIHTVTPILDRQIGDFCNYTTHERLIDNLRCGGNAPTIHCGASCTDRVALLARYNGCTFLPQLCREWEYNDVGALFFQNNMATPLKASRMTAGQCLTVCDLDIRCNGYITVESASPPACLVQTSSVVNAPGAAWTPITPATGQALDQAVTSYIGSLGGSGGGATTFWKRLRPKVLPKYHTSGRQLAGATLALGIVLLVSMVCSCCHLYNVNVKRRGKHTGPELCASLFCPCWGPTPEEKLNELDEEMHSDDGGFERHGY